MNVRTRAYTFGSLAKEALFETLWPTRCCVCDLPGAVLCERCERALSRLDRWRACPRCGAPYGRIQCTECNERTLSALGLERYPFASCSSAVLLDDAARRIVLAWKDGGERRLAAVMADAIARTLPPSWSAHSWQARALHARAGLFAADETNCAFSTVRNGGARASSPESDAASSNTQAPPTRPSALSCDLLPEAAFFIPASRQALSRRGWDHAEELAREVARLLELPVWTPLARPSARDQRALGRRARARNAVGSFQVERPESTRSARRPEELARTLPASVLLLDDVFTTGSTLSAAASALKESGVRTVHCATFARAF